MAFCKLDNYQGQVFKDMNLYGPEGGYVFDAETHEPVLLKEKTKFYTTGNMRLGIGKYRINMIDSLSRKFYCNNYMMGGSDKKYYAVWSLADKPYSPEDIFKKYGYRVDNKHQRIKKYKLSGRMRARRTIKILKERGDYEMASRIEKELQEHLAAGKRYKCPVWFDFRTEEQKKSLK
jgi:hypothetical protein